ncbi:7907_t:CDS:2 [Entrophospora sp. SA101]|nr:7907_t:CDS:2 [Entrophospora sp. SA101]
MAKLETPPFSGYELISKISTVLGPDFVPGKRGNDDSSDGDEALPNNYTVTIPLASPDVFDWKCLNIASHFTIDSFDFIPIVLCLSILTASSKSNVCIYIPTSTLTAFLAFKYPDDHLTEKTFSSNLIAAVVAIPNRLNAATEATRLSLRLKI